MCGAVDVYLEALNGTGDNPVPALRDTAGCFPPVLQQFVALLPSPQLELSVGLVVQNLRQNNKLISMYVYTHTAITSTNKRVIN